MSMRCNRGSRRAMLDGVVFLAADTMRSRAYAQAMAARGWRLKASLIVRAPLRQPGQADAGGIRSAAMDGIFVPDLSVPLPQSCAALCDGVDAVDAGSINAPEVAAWLTAQRPKLVVYSGFGGELVKDHILDAGGHLLHMHSGWLPDYRGSTTLYYSYLAEGRCGVSAILLDRSIDTGAIVGRRHYPPPPPGIDVDYLYDAAIRGNLLTFVLQHWADHGRLPEAIPQDHSEGNTYYIIHPLLKHIALDAIHNG